MTFLCPAVHSAHLSNLNELKTLSASLFSETDPCAGGNGCAHLCQSENGMARCACHAGYQLSEDKKTCEGRKLKLMSQLGNCLKFCCSQIEQLEQVGERCFYLC